MTVLQFIHRCLLWSLILVIGSLWLSVNLFVLLALAWFFAFYIVGSAVTTERQMLTDKAQDRKRKSS